MNPLFIQELQELYSVIKNTNGSVTFGELLYAILKHKKPKEFLKMSDVEVINLIREVQLDETEY